LTSSVLDTQIGSLGTEKKHLL